MSENQKVLFFFERFPFEWVIKRKSAATEGPFQMWNCRYSAPPVGHTHAIKLRSDRRDAARKMGRSYPYNLTSNKAAKQTVES